MCVYTCHGGKMNRGMTVDATLSAVKESKGALSHPRAKPAMSGSVPGVGGRAFRDCSSASWRSGLTRVRGWAGEKATDKEIFQAQVPPLPFFRVRPCQGLCQAAPQQPARGSCSQAGIHREWRCANAGGAGGAGCQHLGPLLGWQVAMVG